MRKGCDSDGRAIAVLSSIRCHWGSTQTLKQTLSGLRRHRKWVPCARRVPLLSACDSLEAQPALAPCARQCARASARARGVGETRATAAAVSPDGGAVTSCPTGRSSGGGGTCGPVGRLACSGLRGVFVPVAGATRSSHRTMQNKSVSSAHEAPIRCVGLSQIGAFSHSARPEATLSLHTAHAQRSLRMTERLPESALTARSLTPRSMQCAHTLARSERRRAPTRR